MTCNDPDFMLSKDSYADNWETDVCGGKEKLKEGIDTFMSETDRLLKILIEKF